MLCHSYRENGKQKRKILATLTKWPKHIVEGLEKIIKGASVFSLADLEHQQGKSVGAIWVLFQLAKQIGLDKALGTGKQAKLALLQIMARCLSQSSRLHIVNHWPEHYALEEVLKIKDSFNENHLYDNLDWLSHNQETIEKRLFDFKYPQGKIAQLYLYDVTSSYFEGTQNEMAAFGYNRDKKKGKKQIVIGLLCDDQGDPVSVEVFKGNTSDLSTFSSQLTKLKEQFGVERVVMVGDKGMIKSKEIDQIKELEWHYITSITKAQIKTLLNHKEVQMGLFEKQPVEVEIDGVRYVFRKNEDRANKIAQTRNDKLDALQSYVDKQNQYLSEHPKAKAEKAVERIEKKALKLKLTELISLKVDKRQLDLEVNEAALEQAALLDGCYVIKTELPVECADTKTVHDRYKELSKVEHAFRTLKTGLEEVRPIFVRKESRTRGHVLVCMLAYKLICKFRSYIDQMNQMPTIKEMLESLNAIHYTCYHFQGEVIKLLPSKLNKTQSRIMETLQLKLPKKLYAK